MRALAWNCRGLGGPSTVSQLKESLRTFKPELIFLSETKRKRGFVGSICKQLGWKDRWYAVDPVGKSGGLLVGWSEEVKIHQIVSLVLVSKLNLRQWILVTKCGQFLFMLAIKRGSVLNSGMNFGQKKISGVLIGSWGGILMKSGNHKRSMGVNLGQMLVARVLRILLHICTWKKLNFKGTNGHGQIIGRMRGT